MYGKIDVTANVSGGGPSSQAGAVRWGIAMALRSFVDEDQIARMRVGKYSPFYLLTLFFEIVLNYLLKISLLFKLVC